VEAVTERESKARLGREVIAKSCEYVSAVSWPQDLANGVTVCVRGVDRPRISATSRKGKKPVWQLDN
jgi:hypothetical protein